MESSSHDDRVFDAVAPISTTSRLLITSLLVAANAIQFMSNFMIFNGGLAITEDLEKPVGRGKQIGCQLRTRRLGEIYGHKRLVITGCLIFAIFLLAKAFCTSYGSFIAMRALTGVGGGLFMPNAVSMMTTMIPPGRMRNVFLGFFAASPPLGGMVGALLTGVFVGGVGWMWSFILVASTTAIVLVALLFITPKESAADPNGGLDYLGGLLGVGSLLIFNIVCNQAPSAGWPSIFTISCLNLTGLMFLSFIIWQTSFASDPIMPLNIFTTASFSALVWVVLFSYMSLGVNFVPFGLTSLLAVFVAAWLMPRVDAKWRMAFGAGASLISSSLLGTMPAQQSYWMQIFPAMVLGGFVPDFVFVVAQVIASNSVSRKQQGIASSLIGTLNLYGTSLGRGLATIVETQVVAKSGHSGEAIATQVFGFRAALYFAVAMAAVELLLDVTLVKMPKDEREGWAEDAVVEKMEMTTSITSAAVLPSGNETQ